MSTTLVLRGFMSSSKAIRGALILATTAVALTLVHVPTTQAAAAQGAVKPAVHKVAIAGVDRAALSAVPKGSVSKAASGSSTSSAASGASAAPTPTDAAPEVFTPALSTEPFTAVGVTWDGASTKSAVTVQLRVRESGTWSSWETLEGDDPAPDPGSKDARGASGRSATEPFFTAGSDGVQVRVDTADGSTPTGVQAVLVDSREVPADAAAQATSTPAGKAPAAGGTTATTSTVGPQVTAAVPPVTPVPPIRLRAAWGADESLKTCIADTDSSMLVGFVHHTVNLNTYTADEVPALIRAIYAYHVQGQGWCDIGYNFLVDKFGRMWEGRYGGIDKGVVGAQVGGFNSESFGVSAIGNFSEVQPPAVMVDSIAQILAWKLSLIGRDPRGAGLVTSGGGGSLFPAGQVVAMNTISGHRDAWATGCPGDYLYPRLGAIRSAAGALVDAAHSPVGHLDSVTPVLGGLRVRGWTLDPDTTGWIYGWISFGSQQGPVAASVDRPDLAAAFPGRGTAHGFDRTYSLLAGTYSVCAWGVNTGPGRDTGIGCTTATVNSSPFGNLDEVRPIAGGFVLQGWAIDPDTSGPIYVWVDVSGRGFPINTGVSRPDVVTAYPTFGDGHGFRTVVPVGPGTYAVCLTAANTGSGNNTSLGCRVVTVS